MTRGTVTATAIPKPMLPAAVEMGCIPMPSMTPHRCSVDQSIRDESRTVCSTSLAFAVAGFDASASIRGSLSVCSDEAFASERLQAHGIHVGGIEARRRHGSGAFTHARALRRVARERSHGVR